MNYSPSPFQPVMQAIVRGDRNLIGSPGNPRGFLGEYRQIHTAKGRKAFVDGPAKNFAKMGGRVIIVWCPYGEEDDEDTMYRPNAHKTDALRWMYELARMLRGLGLSTGTLLRPNYINAEGVVERPVRVAGAKPRKPRERNFLLDHTLEMAEAWFYVGVDCFYLDEFGDQPSDVHILGELRRAGAQHLWMEASCPETVRLAGRYCEEPNVGPWNRPGHLDMMRQIAPNMDIIAMPRKGVTHLDMAKRGYRTIVQDHECAEPERYGLAEVFAAYQSRDAAPDRSETKVKGGVK